MNIVQIYDAIYALLATLYPNKIRIPNPYSLDDNNNAMLKNSYGVIMGPSINTDQLQGSMIVMDRDCSIVLTKQIFDNNTDSTIRVTAEKEIITDMLAIIKGVVGMPGTDNFKFINDEGIEFALNDNFGYLKHTANFVFKNEVIL